jgi:tryptophanyl-tRNA synthetase
VICPVGKKIRKLLDDKSFLEKILKEGTEKAGIIAEHNLKEIRNAVGFI